MRIDEFLRIYPLRSPSLMWFLGAGASASAGVPTAYDMIWDFKRTLYCAAERISVRYCSDLSNPVLRSKIQQHLDADGHCPMRDSADEYACYFERTYPDESDRRRYIDNMVRVATPSYGHLALAALLRLDRIRAMWTTNFDRTVEDASASVLGSTGRLVTTTLDSSQLAIQAINEERWPLLVKLHGDFQSRQLKNIRQELQSQDAQLRRALVDMCKRSGLVVVGYSGRDDSIMHALEEAIDGGHGYPSGLFWFCQSGIQPLARVESFLDTARSSGIDAHFVEVGTFDELMGDLLLLIPDVPDEVLERLKTGATRMTEAPVPSTEGGWPWIRLNAFPLRSWPTICRRVNCNIGGTREVRDAVAGSGASVIAARRNVGVITFGSDSEVRRAFGAYTITEFDVHSIEAPRLRWESAELGLIYDAFLRGLERERPVQISRRRGASLVYVDPARADDSVFSKLKSGTGGLVGKVPQSSIGWAEAIRIRMEYRLDRLWLIIEPTIWIDSSCDDQSAKTFVQRRLAGRYNEQASQVLAGWKHVLTNGQAESEIRALGIGDGIDAAFTISSVTGYSQRRGAR